MQSTPMPSLQFAYNEVHDGLRSGTVAMATFALYRYRSIQAQGAGTISLSRRRPASPQTIARPSMDFN